MVAAIRHLTAKVMHARLIPRVNQFIYGAGYWLIDFSRRDEINDLPLSRHNGWGLFSFWDKDYGFRSASVARQSSDLSSNGEGISLDCHGRADPSQNVEQWLTSLRATYHIPPEYRVFLLTQPRVLGYVFNPVSFWFFLDEADQLRAVVSEVNNTFDERHAYLSFKPDFAPIGEKDWLESPKSFHVSPFLEVKGQYHFRFRFREDALDIRIHYHDERGKVLVTKLAGSLMPEATLGFWHRYLLQPLYIIRVMMLIHYQALRIWRKKIKYWRKPPAPTREITA